MRGLGYSLAWYVLLAVTFGMWRTLNMDVDLERLRFPGSRDWWITLMIGFGLQGAAFWIVARGL